MADSPELVLPERPNARCMEQLIQAAPARELAASEDIRDHRGLLLWAKGQRVTTELRERLIARRLLRPLESSLEFREPLGAMDILGCARRALDEYPVLTKMLGFESQQVLSMLGQLRLLRSPGMLMTAMVQNRPAAMTHAVIVAMITVWLSAQLERSEGAMLDAAEAGFLHDLGELYLDPALLEPTRRLGFEQWRGLCVHPMVGCALLRESGVYAEQVSVAVREHHERVDGSGYPMGGTELSALGRLLLSAEALATLLVSRDHAAARARIALRMIPGQFPREVVDVVSARLRLLPREAPAEVDAARLRQAVVQVLDGLEQGRRQGLQLQAARSMPLGEQQLLEHLLKLMTRYEMAMHESGAREVVGNAGLLAAEPDIADEVYRVTREMAWQLPGLHRHAELMVRNRIVDPTHWQPLLDALDLAIDARVAVA